MPPNILYIHSHDTGRWVQPYGHQVLTPNIQLIADQGVLFRKAFCAAPTCSGSRASLLTGQYCHSNGMMGLAHRGWSLRDYGHHWVHPLREAGYTSGLIGEQHISVDPHVIGYDKVVDLPSNRAYAVAPSAIETIAGLPEPWFVSAGFFETHRSFGIPTSVRDTLYSLPPSNLPDTPETREDMAAFKASVRSLDQGIGAVLNALHQQGQADRTLVVCTTDHGLALPGAKATLFDRGLGVMLLMRGPGGFTGGKVIDAMVSHLDVYPTLCEVAGIRLPEWLQGRSMMPLVRGDCADLHEAVFAEMTYHAAYEPQRAIRTDRWKYIRRFDDYPHPVLPNCDDSSAKSLLLENGWADQTVDPEQLYDLMADPEEGRNRVTDPACAEVLASLRARLEGWMLETNDPLLIGPVPLPPGAAVNERSQVSPDEPLRRIVHQGAATRT
ncbi:MAG TPA: sulfatase [Actinomycetota bacterium]|nr:sulfatase [Actinomycetota bacterium]